MNHLTVPAYCVLVAAASLALLVSSVRTRADSIALIALIALLIFAWRSVVEIRACWPAFMAERRRAAETRRRTAHCPPLRNPPPPTDTH